MNLKYIWKTSVPVFTNGISKQSMRRALFFLFSPAKDKPALGRPQLPTYIRLRQVTALSPQEGLLTYFAPQPSWTTHFGRRKKKQGGEKRGKKEPYRALLVPAHPRSPQHKSSWHRRALSQHRENNHHSVSSLETRSRITLLILPYSSSVALSSSASPTPTLGFSP